MVNKLIMAGAKLIAKKAGSTAAKKVLKRWNI